MNDHKTLDKALWSAFQAGVDLGAAMSTTNPYQDVEAAFGRWRHAWTGNPQDEYSVRITYNMMMLVSNEIPNWRHLFLRDIEGWSIATRKEVVDWATAVHFYASDNFDVVIPPLPEVLKLAEPDG